MLFRLLHFFSGGRLAFSLACAWPTAAMVAVLTSSGFAQTDREHQAYVEAVIRLTQQGESASLERFVLTSESGSLKRNGLEWLVAHSLRRRNAAQAKTFAEQLLSREPDNALALAVSSNAVTQSVSAGSDIENTIDMAKRALQKMPELKAPELMQQGEFSALKDQLISSLNGAVGYAYYERQDYVSARTYLRSAATLAQENARYAYALAICDLFGGDGDEAEGYRLLARTVNLTKGTPAGEELAKFARQNYLARGGSSSDWDRYLANTRSPAASVAASAAAGTQQPQREKTVEIRSAPQNPQSNKGSQTPQKEVASAKTEAVSPTESAHLKPVPSVKRELAPPGSAFSLGILIQTSQASRQGRRPLINTLSDMVRHLREGDEVFLVSFSKNVAFEEDLTGNAKLLERAMDQIRPASGTALFDAVAFAAGHLNRIARNRKRVLLVVSDGQNETSHISPLELSSELKIGDVEIYCIGINSNTREDQYRLQSLAARTGGQAFFVADASQFRSAANRVATDLGIALR